MSISWPERPLEADPVILTSFLRCVPVIRASRWIWRLSSVARAYPDERLACSCLSTVQRALSRPISSYPSRFAAPLCLQCSRPRKQTPSLKSYLGIGEPEGRGEGCDR